jgi:alkylated DNA repair protein alkB family protein 1
VPTGDLVPKLRWANIGRFYHWGTKQYDFSRPKVPVHDHVASICKKAVRTINWSAVFDGSEGSWPEGDAGWGAWTDGYGK